MPIIERYILRRARRALLLTLGALGFTGELPKPPAASAPSIAGTYRLVSRQLPDGTMLRPPEVMGLFTYTRTHRHFNMILG